MELSSQTLAQVFDFPGTGRGLAAKIALKSGEAFIGVPLGRCFTLEAARAAPELQGLADSSAPGRSVSDRDMLCLHLLVERSKGDKSWARQYLDCLPSTADIGLPWTWTADELSELQGTEVYNHAVNIRDEIAEDFGQLQEAVRSSGMASLGVGLEDYTWARCIQSSRYMKLAPTDDSPPFKALVPGLDMANHSVDAPLGQTTLDSDRSMVVSRCGEDLAAGEQIFINYRNDIWNDHLLLTFGFALPKRQLYSCEITFSINVSILQLEAHRKLLNSAPASPKLHSVLHMPEPEGFAKNSTAELVVKHRLTLSTPLPPMLLGMTRIQHLPSDQLSDASCLHKIARCQPVSFTNEFEVLLFLRRLIASKLKALPSDERSDAVMLVQRPPFRKKCALLLRNGERTVLKKASQDLDVSLVALSRDVLKNMAESEGRCGCQACQEFGTPWLHRYDKASSQLEESAPDVARLSKWLLDCLPLALLAQVVVLVHLWVIGCVDDPTRSAMMLCANSWPWAAESTGDRWVDLQLLSKEAEDNAYLELFLDKMAMWGSWFLAQYATCSAVSLPEFIMIKQEQDAIRDSNGWSIPTKEALTLLRQRSPLLLFGRGAGHWAEHLKRHISSFDAVALDPLKQKSAEATACMLLEADRTKTLALLSPDKAHGGSSALRLVSKCKAEILITVGDMSGDKFREAFTDTDEPAPSCFSEQTNGCLKEAFDAINTVCLPSWPGSQDTLVVWRRKRT